jgi:hypothetical protein
MGAHSTGLVGRLRRRSRHRSAIAPAQRQQVCDDQREQQEVHLAVAERLAYRLGRGRQRHREQDHEPPRPAVPVGDRHEQHREHHGQRREARDHVEVTRGHDVDGHHRQHDDRRERRVREAERDVGCNVVVEVTAAPPPDHRAVVDPQVEEDVRPSERTHCQHRSVHGGGDNAELDDRPAIEPTHTVTREEAAQPSDDGRRHRVGTPVPL